MDFSALAAGWDSEVRIKRAEIIARKIIETLHGMKGLSALEFGCGTGLISFNLHDEFERIDLIDSSEGMISRLKEKIAESGIRNMNPLCLDLTRNAGPEKKYDVIFTSMVLHHISDLPGILEKFSNLLKHKGVLCIVDLDPVSELFHKGEPDFSGHHGFETSELTDLLAERDFTQIKAETFYRSEKKSDAGAIPYSLFILTARKGSI